MCWIKLSLEALMGMKALWIEGMRSGKYELLHECFHWRLWCRVGNFLNSNCFIVSMASKKSVYIKLIPSAHPSLEFHILQTIPPGYSRHGWQNILSPGNDGCFTCAEVSGYIIVLSKRYNTGWWQKNNTRLGLPSRWHLLRVENVTFLLKSISDVWKTLSTSWWSCQK